MLRAIVEVISTWVLRGSHLVALDRLWFCFCLFRGLRGWGFRFKALGARVFEFAVALSAAAAFDPQPLDSILMAGIKPHIIK